MKLVFSGLELPIVTNAEAISVIEIHNRALFARICQSLASFDGVRACEPFAVWNDEGKEISSKNAYLLVGDVFSLPWNERDLTGVLQQRFEELLFEDYTLRNEIESLHRDISSRISSLGFQMLADYSFGLEWDMRRYLKAFDFGADLHSATLLDNLIAFVLFAADMGFSRVLVFVNLKLFLTEKQLETLYGQAIFSGISLLLLETVADERIFRQERKRVVDLHFVES